jgi:hypothetical protein
LNQVGEKNGGVLWNKEIHTLFGYNWG